MLVRCRKGFGKQHKHEENGPSNSSAKAAMLWAICYVAQGGVCRPVDWQNVPHKTLVPKNIAFCALMREGFALRTGGNPHRVPVHGQNNINPNYIAPFAMTAAVKVLGSLLWPPPSHAHTHTPTPTIMVTNGVRFRGPGGFLLAVSTHPFHARSAHSARRWRDYFTTNRANRPGPTRGSENEFFYATNFADTSPHSEIALRQKKAVPDAGKTVLVHMPHV